MRKLRDQGKFKNSMLAEIEADERVEVPKKLAKVVKNLF